MNRVSTRLSIILAVLLVFATGFTQAQTYQVDWKLFSSGIKMALKGNNPGVQQSAICLLIKYGDKLDIGDGISDLVAYYHRQQDQTSKKMALLAIYRINQEKAVYLLGEQLDNQVESVRNELIKVYRR